MAFETNTPTSMNDLMASLSSFAQLLGWTENRLTLDTGFGGTDGQLSLAKGSNHIHFAWNEGEANHISMYQSLGFDGQVDQWEHPEDSGNGEDSEPSEFWSDSTILQERAIANIGSGPYESYWFYGDGDYVHIVLEFSPGRFRHFGFGTLDKSWDWTGGEYCYAHTARIPDPKADNYDCLLASSGTSTLSRESFATIHAEGLPNQDPTSKWGVFLVQDTISEMGADRAGNPRVRFDGGAPGGVFGTVFLQMTADAGQGFLPLSPLGIFYTDVSVSPPEAYLMGFQPDVAIFNGRNYHPADEFTIGSDTYQVFPHARKTLDEGSNDRSGVSRNLFIAYRKIIGGGST